MAERCRPGGPQSHKSHRKAGFAVGNGGKQAWFDLATGTTHRGLGEPTGATVRRSGPVFIMYTMKERFRFEPYVNLGSSGGPEG